MQWLTANWFWVLIFIAFIAMHLFGHGGHGRHGGSDRKQPGTEGERGVAQDRVVNTRGHQH